MNLSISTWNYLCAQKNAADLHKAIAEILSAGFGVELWLGWNPDPAAVERSNWGRLKELLGNSTPISLHTRLGRWDWDLLKEEIDMCQYLGGKIVVVHSGTIDVGAPQTSDDFANARMAAEYAVSRNVILALENGAMKILRRALDEVGGVSEDSGLGICIDVGHANLRHQEFDDPVAEYIDDFKDDLVHFHLADNHGERDEHLVPGAGTIDWEMVCSKIAGMRFERQCTLELNTQDAAKAAADAVESLDRFQ